MFTIQLELQGCQLSTHDPIRILQIGDVHYPNAIASRPVADLKRDPFDVSQSVAPTGLRLRKIVSALSKYSSDYFDAIAFMGDFTTGNPNRDSQMASMADCVKYLDENIVKPLLGRSRRNSAMFVPGNHDVDRTLCPSTNATRLEKLNYYRDTLVGRGLINHSTSDPSQIHLSKNLASASLWGLNTCIGCGEFLSFPESVKRDFVAKLSAVLVDGATDAAQEIVESFLDLTERLDAPLIEAEILHKLDTELTDRMRKESNSIQVVVGHHNLLPQIIPRVAPFSELVNSGGLRQFLATKDLPVIYLHGHIHADPIEIVFSQERPESCVISISAPEFSDGFNVVELHFDDERTPMGVSVLGVRQSATAQISHLPPRRIPFRQGRHRIASITELAREIFYKTFSKNAQLHFNTIQSLYSKRDVGAIERAIVELEWLGLVQIANRDRPSRQWNVASAI